MLLRRHLQEGVPLFPIDLRLPLVLIIRKKYTSIVRHLVLHPLRATLPNSVCCFFSSSSKITDNSQVDILQLSQTMVPTMVDSQDLLYITYLDIELYRLLQVERPQFGRVTLQSYPFLERQQFEGVTPQLYPFLGRQQFGRVILQSYPFLDRQQFGGVILRFYLFPERQQFGRVILQYFQAEHQQFGRVVLPFLQAERQQYGMVTVRLLQAERQQGGIVIIQLYLFLPAGRQQCGMVIVQ